MKFHVDSSVKWVWFLTSTIIVLIVTSLANTGV